MLASLREQQTCCFHETPAFLENISNALLKSMIETWNIRGNDSFLFGENPQYVSDNSK